MDSLPLEIKHIICRFVKADSRNDLSSVSRINHAWYNTAAPFVYETLRIGFHNGGNLPNITAQVHEQALGRPFLKYARRLDIICSPDPSRQTAKARPVQDINKWTLDSIDSRLPATISTFLDHRLKRCHDQVLSFSANECVYYTDRDWQPIVSLIRRLDRLTELNYVVQNIFPTELSATLTRTHPTCKVNVWTHQSLNLDPPDPTKPSLNPGPPSKFTDPFDPAVFLSTQLHTFCMFHSMSSGQINGTSGKNMDESLFFALIAPNLKHLSFRNLGYLTEKDVRKIKGTWEKLSRAGHTTPTASLDSLSFDAHPSLSPWEDVLLNMTQLVDLSRLRSLEIGVYSNPNSLRTAASKLHGLERLYINMHPWKLHHDNIHADDDQMVAAVMSFYPLKFLCLEGLRNFYSLRDILSRHGHTLEGLIVQSSTHARRLAGVLDTGFKYPVWTNGQITEIAQICPNLEELCIPFKRDEGSPQECGLYKELGGFPRLRTLVLDLHYDPRERPVAPWPVEPATDPEMLRKTLSNAAVDEVLVAKIWHLIISNQSSRRLKNLRVTPVGIEFFDKLEQQVLGQLGRSFLVRPPNLGELRLDIQEIGRTAWNLWRESQVGEESTHVPKPVELVLRELWPSIRLGNGTIGGWRSLPLQDFDLSGPPLSSRINVQRSRSI
ncbi:hypothetical protein N7532_002782 [Penicillium argentinense]|uniref:F-box domain-containing protein n=1 Tax=Penicillium argentinense TaxID=1131581 RepID=A0A9W9G2L8_9EURO|nr:uncharacterized protein N7532_002782 [Penicillium argentinense]KAJ5110137.1 hypothetical protein N7532_002782 [Penicillium argentinense]